MQLSSSISATTPFSASRLNTELLMSLGVSLGDLTQSVTLAGQIPAYLAATLHLEPITLAVVREAEHGDPSLFLYTSSDGVATGASACVPPTLLSIYRKTRMLMRGNAAAHGGAGRSVFEIDQDHARLSAHGLLAYPRANVFAHALDDHHYMILMVHQREQDAALSPAMAEVLHLAARQLARLLDCLVASQTRPVVLGKSFNELTDKQWEVLQALDSELSEKQLAEQLGLSPHTLHSHIKSVYRRLGVQGRLPMLKLLSDARRRWRMQQLNEGAKVVTTGFHPCAATA